MLDLVIDGHIAQVVLNNPAKRNAMGPWFWDEMPKVFRRIDEDLDVRVAVLRAEDLGVRAGREDPERAWVIDGCRQRRVAACQAVHLHPGVLQRAGDEPARVRGAPELIAVRQQQHLARRDDGRGRKVSADADPPAQVAAAAPRQAVPPGPGYRGCDGRSAVAVEANCTTSPTMS